MDSDNKGELDVAKFIAEAPCSQPGFVFKPYVQYCEAGDTIFVYIANRPAIDRRIDDRLTIIADADNPEQVIGVKIRGVSELLKQQGAE